MTRYIAKKPFGYCGMALDTGQVIELAGVVNDVKLVSLGYFSELPVKVEVCRCGECGAEFAEEWQRQAHGEARHTMIASPPVPTRATRARARA